MEFHMIAGGPTPVAPFSHAVEAGGFVFVTGQMPDTPAAPGVLPDGIVAQTRAVMEDLHLVLAGVGLGFADVVMARIYLTRFAEDYAAMNGAWCGYFAAGRLPARTCVGVTGLAYDARVEIDLVARRAAAVGWRAGWPRIPTPVAGGAARAVGVRRAWR